jgi:hypothetical protein
MTLSNCGVAPPGVGLPTLFADALVRATGVQLDLVPTRESQDCSDRLMFASAEPRCCTIGAEPENR